MMQLYPVTIMGGLKLVYAIRKSMPSIPLVASQGIALGKRNYIKMEFIAIMPLKYLEDPVFISESVEEYFIAGTSAVVLSDAIFHKPLVEAKDFRKIRKRAAMAAEKAVLPRVVH
jgi:2-keto-3-deoxy-6-phosphogluconate aldolase